MNNYLVVTNDKITLDEKIKELNKDNSSEVVFYDLIETNIEKLIEDLDTINFLSNKKIIVGTNAFFLSSDKTKSNIEHNTFLLEKYLDNPSDNILILVTDNIDKRKKLTSNILKKCELIEEISDINSLIKKRLEDYEMDNSTISKLIEFCGNDHERIFNELEKLKLYKLDSKKITTSDIEEIVSPVLDDNIFHFVDSILSGNKEYAFKLYHNFLLHGEQVVHMLILISNKIRLIYQVKILSNKGNSDQSISKLLNMHEYPIKLAREASYKYSEKHLLEILLKLAELDLEIKSGETIGEVEFETLLASI